MRLWADFNEVDDDTVWTSLRRASFVPKGEPRVGQWIELWDHEGNVCWGVVTEVDAPIVYLRLDLSTWVDREAVSIEGQYGDPVSSQTRGQEQRTGIERAELVLG